MCHSKLGLLSTSLLCLFLFSAIAFAYDCVNTQPDSYGVGIWPDVGFIIADDFQCSQPDAIMQIEVSGFWWWDYLPNGNPGNVQFTLSIYANIPAGQSPTGFAIPGQILWTRTYEPGQFTFQPVFTSTNTGFYVPTWPYFEDDSGVTTTYYKYSFDLYSGEFAQQGGNTIYWLSVSTVPVPDDGSAIFGWVTTPPGQSPSSNAVFGDGTYWYGQMYYPSGQQYSGSPIDMAFAIKGSTSVLGALL